MSKHLLGKNLYGVFTFAEAIAAGVPQRTLARWVKEGRVRRLLPQVYAFAAVPESYEMQLAAAVAWAPGVAAVSHRAAAHMLGAPGRVRRPVEITMSTTTKHPSELVVHRSNYLPERHLMAVRGLTVTDWARTAFDLGAVVQIHHVRNFVFEALRRKKTSTNELYRRLIEHGGRGRRGCGSLRQVLRERDPALDRTESLFEELMFEAVWSGELPRPVQQHRVVLPNGRVVRPDFSYPDIRLAVEAEGYAPHADPRYWDSEHDRRNALTMAGWLVLYYTWNQVKYESDRVIAEIAAAIAERSAQFLTNFS